MRVLYQICFSSAEQQELHHNEDFPEPMCWAVAETLPTADGSRMRFGQGASWMGDTGPGIDTLRPPRQVLQTLPEPTQRVLTGQGKSGKGQHVAPGGLSWYGDGRTSLVGGAWPLAASAPRTPLLPLPAPAGPSGPCGQGRPHSTEQVGSRRTVVRETSPSCFRPLTAVGGTCRPRQPCGASHGTSS